MSPARRPGTPPREARHTPSSSLEKAEVEAAQGMFRGSPPEAQASHPAPETSSRYNADLVCWQRNARFWE